MATEDVSPGTALRDPDTRAVAVRMGKGVTAGKWFVVSPEAGGHYSDEAPAWPELHG